MGNKANMNLPIYEEVIGSPFQPRQLVRVTSAVDEEVHDVSTHVGRRGMIEYLEYSCGAGQTYPHDPMIGVRFTNGDREEFWHEELTALPRLSSSQG